MCTLCLTGSASLKRAVTPGFVIFNEDPVVTPDIFLSPRLSKKFKSIQMGRFSQKENKSL